MSDGGATTGSADEDTKLARTVGTVLLFFFIVGDTLGAGIYTLVGTMAEDVGGVLWLPLVIALVVALLTAGTYAEMISKYPHAGGAARYAERAYKTPFLTFLVGFFMLSSGIVTAALLANAFSGDYLTALVDLPVVPVTVVFLLLLTAINLRGVRESLAANAVATIIETSGLVLVIVVAAIVFGSGGGDPTRMLTPSPDQPLLVGAFAASVVAFFSFLGLEAAANMAEEVKRPSRAYPRHDRHELRRHHQHARRHHRAAPAVRVHLDERLVPDAQARRGGARALPGPRRRPGPRDHRERRAPHPAVARDLAARRRLRRRGHGPVPARPRRAAACGAGTPGDDADVLTSAPVPGVTPRTSASARAIRRASRIRPPGSRTTAKASATTTALRHARRDATGDIRPDGRARGDGRRMR
jgi:hypothetical protein